jgi:hypothetical protein
MAWNKITVRQYIALKPINDTIKELEALPKPTDTIEAVNLSIDIMEAKSEKMSIMFGKPKDFFMNLSTDKFVESYKHVLRIEAEPLPKTLNEVIKVNGNKYIAFVNPSKFNVHQWYAYLGYKSDIIGHMAKMLPWIYRPEGFDYDKHEPSDYENDMLDAKLTDISGCFFLLLTQWQKWQTKVLQQNEMLMETLTSHLNEAEQWARSQSTTVGFTP